MTEAYVDRALRLSWTRGINNVSGPVTYGLRDWLLTGNYSVTSASSNLFSLRYADPDDVLRAYGYDANRMACGALESILSISKVISLERSLAWLAIKLYYAAFYSAHSLMRLQGVSCTQLDSKEANKVSSVAQAYGITGAASLNSGFHVARIDPFSGTIEWTKLGSTGGGTHESTWSEYLRQLNEMTKLISNSNLLRRDKVAIANKLTDFRDVLTQSNCRSGNWLSRVRNDITYRHGQGVWFPHANSNDADKYLRLITQYLTQDPYLNDIEKDDSFEAFVKACLFVTSITKATLLDMASRLRTY